MKAVLLLALVGFAVAIGTALLFGKILIPQMAEGKRQLESTQYYAIYHPNLTVPDFTVNSTNGTITIPIKGYVNIVTAQYVKCPDVCHWETDIMLATFELIKKHHAEDKIVFVTIGVDPWDENLAMARAYMEMKAGKYLRQGMKWVWVLNPVEKQLQIYKAYKISVVKHNDTRLVDHWAGFMVVVGNKVVSVIVPTSDGWATPHAVAEAVWREASRYLDTVSQTNT